MLYVITVMLQWKLRRFYIENIVHERGAQALQISMQRILTWEKVVLIQLFLMQ